MTRYYPIFVDLRDRPCLVVVGGAVAEGKALGLLEAGARVTVVSPTVTERLAALRRADRIAHVAREYRAGDVAGHALAFVATDGGAVNAAVAAEGRARDVWINAADDPAHCDFILPAVVRRGELVVAVATGGTCPGLAGIVREQLEGYLPEDYALLSQVMAEVRLELRGRGCAPTAGAWRVALDSQVLRLVGEGRRDEAVALLLQRLRSAA